MKAVRTYKNYEIHLGIERYAFRIGLVKYAPDYSSAFILFMLSFGYTDAMCRFSGHDLFFYIDGLRKYEPERQAFGWCKRFEK